MLKTTASPASAGPIRLGREERLEDALDHLGRHAAAESVTATAIHGPAPPGGASGRPARPRCGCAGAPVRLASRALMHRFIST
jgi:hypothetical protein